MITKVLWKNGPVWESYRTDLELSIRTIKNEGHKKDLLELYTERRNMNNYLWLLVVIFIFHDMEEIVGENEWINKNYDSIVEEYPFARKILSNYLGVSTGAFALAVYEELILLIVICLLASLTHNPILYGIWFGGLVGFTIHLFIHIGQALIIRRYIPALITSIISIPPSIMLILKTAPLLEMSPTVISGIIFGILGVAINLKFAHKLMHKYN